MEIAVYVLQSNTSVDVRYTLNHRPKIALFNNGGYEALQLGVLDSAKVWTSPNVDTALSAGSFSGLADCYTFCSESHWDNATAPNYPTDTSIVSKVWSFVEEGGNFLAQCAGIDKYENQMQHPRHFQSSNGIVDQATAVTNAYSNPDMAYAQFVGTVVSRGGPVASYPFRFPQIHLHGALKCMRLFTIPQAIQLLLLQFTWVIRIQLVEMSYLPWGGIDYQSTANPSNGNEIANQTYINGARMYLNAAFIPARLRSYAITGRFRNVSICQGSSATLGGSPTASGSRWSYMVGV